MRLPDLRGAGGEIEAELARLARAQFGQHSAEELMADPNLPNHPVSEPLLRRIGAHVLRRSRARAANHGVAIEVLDLAEDAGAPVIVATRGSDRRRHDRHEQPRTAQYRGIYLRQRFRRGLSRHPLHLRRHSLKGGQRRFGLRLVSLPGTRARGD
jgi:hypothetical protein